MVLSVLSILFAILAAPLAKGRRYALLAHCANNLHKVHGANMLYLQDNDWHKPEFRAWENDSNSFTIVFAGTVTRHDGELQGQGRVVSAYLNNQIELLLCPAITVAGDVERDRAAWLEGRANAGSSYLYEWTHPSALSFTSALDLENLREHWRFNNEPGTHAMMKDLNVMSISGVSEPFLAHRNLKQCNILFNDGRVKAYPHSEGVLAAAWTAQDILDLFELCHSLRPGVVP